MKITVNNLNDVFKCKKMSVETAELKGYELIENLFCDNSGCGASNEPAYTANGFIDKMKVILSDNPTVYCFITDVGQFQVYVGVFKKTGESQCKKIGNNTLEIIKDGKRIIRFHDTNILTFEGDKVILSSGGYHTSTTKKRLNQYLPKYTVYQKDFNWYVKNGDNKAIEFKDGMELPCAL